MGNSYEEQEDPFKFRVCVLIQRAPEPAASGTLGLEKACQGDHNKVIT